MLQQYAAVCLLMTSCLVGTLRADEPSLTFFAWSDQHVQIDGDAEHVKPAIDAMNQLPGKAYPPKSGGDVAGESLCRSHRQRRAVPASSW